MMEGRKVDWRHICSCVQSGNNASETSFVGRFIDQITIHVVRCYLAIHPLTMTYLSSGSRWMLECISSWKDHRAHTPFNTIDSDQVNLNVFGIKLWSARRKRTQIPRKARTLLLRGDSADQWTTMQCDHRKHLISGAKGALRIPCRRCWDNQHFEPQM